MNKRILITMMATTMVASGMAIAETTTITISEQDARTIVTGAGYGEPVLVTQDGDLWRLQSMDKASNEEVILFVNGEGKILSAGDVVELRLANKQPTTVIRTEVKTPVTKETVALVAMNAGFRNVHDIDYLDSRGLWKLEADDISGEDYELHIEPNTGRIVHIEDD
jgi:hypothetical protein